MMTLPIYKREGNESHPHNLNSDANVGLWFTRFYNGFDAGWSVSENNKSQWIKTFAGKHGNVETLKKTAQRLEALGTALGAEITDFKTDWHFATGLGLSHPVENGFTWHHTLGLPYLPASGIKGILRGWVEAWMEHKIVTDRNTTINRLFGSVKGELDATENSAGNLIFFDAIPTKPVTLACDIMTPHMGSWYEKGGNIESESDYADSAPADWHSPVPVPFLVVKSASFRFMIAPRLIGVEAHDTQAKQDAKTAIGQLSLALQWMGAGAKTAAGYGRFFEDKLANELRNRETEQQALNDLSPKDRAEAEIQKMDDKKLKEMFGKGWNAKKAEDEAYAALLIQAMYALKPNLVDEWKSKNKNDDKIAFKAYKKLSGQIDD